ncbi:phospholipid-binding protein MlaC, partial [Sneathiella sp.]|uniref:MlaC/ttg2D family ABC transporter substrate-binding protein n=1 Tax=Sneathiella sp. TaxID=1964365 RepID=UPI0035665789
MLKTKILPALFMIIAVTAASAIPSAVSATETKEQAAIDLVKSLGNKAVETLANNSLSPEQKNEQFENYMDEGFDMKLVGRFVLGNAWRNASDAQKKEFQSVFRDYMVATYSEKIGSYSGENLKVNDATSLNDKESLV